MNEEWNFMKIFDFVFNLLWAISANQFEECDDTDYLRISVNIKMGYQKSLTTELIGRWIILTAIRIKKVLFNPNLMPQNIIFKSNCSEHWISQP